MIELVDCWVFAALTTALYAGNSVANKLLPKNHQVNTERGPLSNCKTCGKKLGIYNSGYRCLNCKAGPKVMPSFTTAVTDHMIKRLEKEVMKMEGGSDAREILSTLAKAVKHIDEPMQREQKIKQLEQTNLEARDEISRLWCKNLQLEADLAVWQSQDHIMVEHGYWKEVERKIKKLGWLWRAL